MKLKSLASKLTITGVALMSCALISTTAQARGIAEGTITKVTAGSNNTNIFLSVDITAVNGETVPACATTNKYFVLGADQKSQLAVALTALALGSTVKVVGADVCTFTANAEDVSFLQVVN